MSVLHRVRDICELDGPTFFTLAYRLPAYEGATRVALTDLFEGMEEEEAAAALEAEASKYPPRYVDVDLDEMRVKEGRVVGTPKAVREDRAATLQELRASGPAAPALGQLAPIFEMPVVTD
jgi:hypothetical protein